MKARTDPASRPKKFWLLCVFILIVFLTGGGARIDIQSLLFLQPVSVVVLAIALGSLRSEHVKDWKLLIGFVTGIIALAIVHVIPLPPGIWQSLAGREELIEVERLVGLSDVWRPLTMTPMNGWHAIVSFFPVLAVLFLSVQLTRNQRNQLLPLFLALGLLSGLLGILQILGNPEGPLYFYRITNSGSAVGLFANRNHAAILLACLFPMLAAYATAAQGTPDHIRNRHVMALAAAVVLVPLILVTGSRTGLVVSIVGLVGAAAIYSPPQAPSKRAAKSVLSLSRRSLVAVSVVIALGVATVLFSRAEAITRLFSVTAEASSRDAFWTASFDLFWKCFPWGCGSGSFVEAFQIIEPSNLIDSTYLNHAHNDWIETAATFGIPGIVALLAIVSYWIFGIWQVSQRTQQSPKTRAPNLMAAVIMAIFGIASIFDYPLRTPSLQILFLMACFWLLDFRSDRSSAQISDLSRQK